MIYNEEWLKRAGFDVVIFKGGMLALELATATTEYRS